MPPVAIFVVEHPVTIAPQPYHFSQVREMVLDAEAKYGLSDMFLDTLTCESGLHPDRVGDNGTSFGVAQIHLPAHPDVTKEEALDPEFAIEWSAQQFAAGRAYMWTCYRLLDSKNDSGSIGLLD